MRVVVTGGGGYVGYHVGWVLSKGGHHVTLLDLTPPDPEWQVTAPLALHDALNKGFWGKEEEEVTAGPLEYVKGSVTCPEDLDTAFKGATGVIHTASCGVSGRQQLSPHDALVEEINVVGTREVIAAALRAQESFSAKTLPAFPCHPSPLPFPCHPPPLPSLPSCRCGLWSTPSTYNVVFGGEEIQGGDETMPTYPLHAHTDHYSRSGMMFFTFGRRDMLVDFVSIQAHVKALLALLYERGYPGDLLPLLRQHPTCTTDHDPNNEGQQQHQQHHPKHYNDHQQQHDPKTDHDHQQQHHPRNSDHLKQQQQQQHNTPQSVSVGLNSGPFLVSGEAFFINDAAPVNHFEYFRPWFQGLGYSFPSHALPLWIILLFAHLQHAVYKLVYRFFPFCPLFTPAETYKSGVRHYFSCRKAQECFGYAPTRPNDHTEIVKYLIDKGYNNNMNNTGIPGQLVLVLGFILIALTLGYSLFTFLC
ncbi:hypothetical protein Pmani_025569 [Petrolisthes manimaculis]|uniref:NAD-dependent epimerase/dehydratase domain-containing protein n=1 Tax=Petrolisthes manimaculis TaxID=1843537 RepID=A0AAE1P7Z0_9EUCA|nr:hypothetical protein Pmani_025569 [Petrolisthes manimaculis]